MKRIFDIFLKGTAIERYDLEFEKRKKYALRYLIINQEINQYKSDIKCIT